MRIVVQRVSEARVEVEGQTVGRIGLGLLVYLSVGKGDGEKDAKYIAEKVVNLRVFADGDDKMNLSVREVGGAILVISQFTLHGDIRKGRRPSFDEPAEPELAERLYEYTIGLIREQQVAVEEGVFLAHMDVSSVNDGPVTFLLDSGRVF